MIKILHTADWHLDSPLSRRDPAIRQELLKIPSKIAGLCQRERCDLVLIAGDIFDGAPSPESIAALTAALAEMAVPVAIAPGNHDYVTAAGVWNSQVFPGNVHIFRNPRLEPWVLEGYTLWGAGYTSMDCPPLLEGFRAPEGLHIGILHGDPTVAASPCCPVSRAQIEGSGLTYLALGHIHKAGQLTAGGTLCVWPGCPMGRGFDETGEKGVYITQVGDTVTTRFVALDTPRFYDLACSPEGLDSLLPPAGSDDYYRVTLEGESEAPDLEALLEKFSSFPHLVLRDRTVPPVDIWKNAGADSLEGVFFGLLKAQNTPEATLAATISRRLWEGQEVVLP